MKIRIHLFAFMLLLSGLTMNTVTASAKANSAATISAMTTDQQQARAMEIKQRVDQIKAMNFANMSSAERKDMRHELKDMNKELRAMDPTVIYISGGALILISYNIILTP